MCDIKSMHNLIMQECTKLGHTLSIVDNHSWLLQPLQVDMTFLSNTFLWFKPTNFHIAENFANWILQIAHWCPQKDTVPPNFTENLCKLPQNLNLWKISSTIVSRCVAVRLGTFGIWIWGFLMANSRFNPHKLLSGSWLEVEPPLCHRQYLGQCVHTAE